MVTTFPLSLLVGGGIDSFCCCFCVCVCCKRLRNVKRVFAREKEKSGSPNRRARRILDAGAPQSERAKAKKKQQQQKKSKQPRAAQKRVQNGSVGYFFCVLFRSICGLKWLLFFEHQHNLYHPITHDENSQAPHHTRRRRERRHEEEKKW